jgi:sulfate permease, SulP family
MGALTDLAGGLIAYVPPAALSGILVYVALRIFRISEMIQIYRRSGPEILLVAASAGLVNVVARPYSAELARLPGTTVWWPPGRDGQGEYEVGVLVFAPAAPLNFTPSYSPPNAFVTDEVRSGG